MAFTLPTFNLMVNIWRAGNPHSNPPDVTSVCNLAMGRRVASSAGIVTGVTATSNYWFLLLPALTDIRDSDCPSGADSVECPAGTLRFYNVVLVDDAGKGFANEHRVAFIEKVSPWPQPIP